LFDKELFIHPFHLLKKEVQNQKSCVILGTKHSMDNPYFNSFIENKGIKITKEEELLVDEFRTAIYQNTETLELIEQFENLLLKLEKDYSVIVACTELSAYLSATKNKFQKTIDLALLQIKEAVNQVNL
jgi:aspartate racemase